MSRSEHPFINVTEDALVLRIHVQPRASKNEVCGIQGDALKIRLTSPPVDGAANKLCREFIADLLGVSRSSVEIISGGTSRFKRVKITGDDAERLIKIIDGIVMSD